MLPLTVSATAPGKVNLYFAVGPVKPDGYHDVASLYAAVDIFETVTISETDTPGIAQSMSVVAGSLVDQLMQAGHFDPASVPLNESNLAYRGALAVLTEAGLTAQDVSLQLHIDKAVPVAGGMGGGSADAAAAMKATNAYLVESGRLAQHVPQERLLELAAPLGADVPFALLGGLAVGEGIGDKLTPISLPSGIEPLRLVLSASPIGLSTPAVFKELDAGRQRGTYPEAGELKVPEALIGALTSTGSHRAQTVARLLRNDLAAPAAALHPDVQQRLDTGLGAGELAGFVSGSGPTVGFIVGDLVFESPAGHTVMCSLSS
ncbi:MAG: 4-diphosphocytidyl-2C-methyl-D-erythritol kinase [Rothia sp. (in: high G+C Gram-positive bacteria)]|nr:4-diphosphocytidyl-2C-methyl-D-erythritol kinase [Rothia sp. (in: high G+C Gram-positive bacteria)]